MDLVNILMVYCPDEEKYILENYKKQVRTNLKNVLVKKVNSELEEGSFRDGVKVINGNNNKC